MTKEHNERLLQLLDALSEAKIYAGAEFEALCNEKNYESAYMFNMLRDTLQAERVVIADYITMNKE